MKTKKKAPIIRIKGFDDDWKRRKLGAYVNIISGESPSKFEEGTELYVKVDDLNYNSKYVVDTQNKVAEHRTIQKVVKGSVVFPKRGAAIMTNKVRILGIDSYMDTNMMALTSDDLDSEFLFNIISKEGLYKIADTSTIPQINNKHIEPYDLLIPSLDEQKQIGEYFKQFDHLITLHQREIDRIVYLRKAMVEKLFPQNGADVPAVRFSRYKEPWRLCQFSEIFTERHIIDTISDEYPQLAFTIEEGVIRPEDKKTNKRDFLIIDKATKKYLQTEYDDIIYNPANVIYGAIHRNALGKGCVSPIYKIFYTDQDSTFMECIVRHPNFIKEISRSMEGTVKKLRTLKPKAFLEMSAYIAPTIEEQRQIGEYFRQMDRLIEIEKEELEKIKHIKSACLEKMFV